MIAYACIFNKTLLCDINGRNYFIVVTQANEEKFLLFEPL